MVVLVVLSRVERGQDVLRRDAVRVVEVSQRSQVGGYRLIARIQFQQNLIGVGGRLTDPFALTADTVGER